MSTPTDATAPAVRLDHVVVTFGGRKALDDVSFSVQRGSFTALIGPNGAGKSTLLRVLLGLVRPDAGVVEVFGGTPGRTDATLGYVPQRIAIPRGFPISVLDVVLMGRYGVLGPGRRPGRDDHDRARTALDQVGLVDSSARRFQDLSGGQQQRVLIARALVAEPQLLLLDEPTVGLDSAARARFYALVCELQRARGLSLLSATHDLDVIGEHADRFVLLDGTVRADGPPGQVLASGALGRAYPFPAHHVHGDEV